MAQWLKALVFTFLSVIVGVRTPPGKLSCSNRAENCYTGVIEVADHYDDIVILILEIAEWLEALVFVAIFGPGFESRWGQL